MRFVSKSSNLCVILKAGLPSEPLTGRPAQPTISVRFQDGIAEVRDEELIKLMEAHPGFNMDFIAVDDGSRDPYAHSRAEVEPVHVLTDMKYGSPERRTIGKQKVQLTPEMYAAVQSVAAEMAKEMLPGLLKGALKDLAKIAADGQVKDKKKEIAAESTENSSGTEEVSTKKK